MKIVSLIIGGSSLMLSMSLWASTNNVYTNQQQITKFKQDSYAAAARVQVMRQGKSKQQGTSTNSNTKGSRKVNRAFKDEPILE